MGISLSNRNVFLDIAGNNTRSLYLNNKDSVSFNGYQGLQLFDGTRFDIYSVEGNRGTYTGDGTSYRSIFIDDKFNINEGVAIITAVSENLCGIIYRGCNLIFTSTEMYSDIGIAEIYAQVLTLKDSVPFNFNGVEYEYFIV